MLSTFNVQADELNYTVLSRDDVQKDSEDFSTFISDTNNKNNWNYTFHPIYQELFGPIDAITNPVREMSATDVIRRIKTVFKDPAKKAHLLAVSAEVKRRMKKDNLEQPGKEELDLMTLVDNFENHKGSKSLSALLIAEQAKPIDPTKNFSARQALLGSPKQAALKDASAPTSSTNQIVH
jgi:hypothetical protein